MGLLGLIFIDSIHVTLFTPWDLRLKMTFYAKNFLELKDDLIMWPLTRFGIICMGLGSPLGLEWACIDFGWKLSSKV